MRLCSLKWKLDRSNNKMRKIDNMLRFPQDVVSINIVTKGLDTKKQSP